MQNISSPLQSDKKDIPNIGAQSLSKSLLSQSDNRYELGRNIEMWMNALEHSQNGNQQVNNLTTEEKNIRNWYITTCKIGTYQAPNWQIEPRYTALFAQFRKDHYYHLKNLVEVIIRGSVEALLEKEGIVKVYRTSDTDDVIAGVDLIVEKKKLDGTFETYGIDIAITSNEDYIKQKGIRENTTPNEFNAFKGRGNVAMRREVFPISPGVMSYFLQIYMRRVANGQAPNKAQSLQLLQEACNNSTARVRKNTYDRVTIL